MSTFRFISAADSAQAPSNCTARVVVLETVSNQPLPSFLSVRPDGVLLAIKLQPRASANEILGPLGEELRIKVTAPPVDAAANEALVRFLAEKLDCSRGQVELIRGHTSRHKTIKLHGLAADVVAAKLH